MKQLNPQKNKKTVFKEFTQKTSCKEDGKSCKFIDDNREKL